MGILVKISECVGTLTKLEIPIREKRVRLVPPDAKWCVNKNDSFLSALLCL